MASITTRNFERDVKRCFRIFAAEHGCSMGEEAREISRQVVEGVALPRDLTAAIRARILPFDGSDAEPCTAVAASRRAADRLIGQFGCQTAAI